MIDTTARRARLVARHHLTRSGVSVDQVTSDLVALHSSDPLSPHLGLWARVDGYRPEDLDHDLVSRRALWRLHAMRRTLWIVRAEEVAALDAAVGRDIARKERQRVTGWIQAARPDAEAWLRALERGVLEVVAEQPGITTRELTAARPELAAKILLGTGKWQTETAVASRLLMVLAMELKVQRTSALGTWKSSQYGWALPDAPERVPEAAGRVALVRRYVERFGPVTTTDVKWWTGLTLTQTRQALAASGSEEVDIEGGTAWRSPGPPAGDPTREAVAVALLPALDPTPMGYKERAWFVGEHEAALYDGNGNVGPTIWVDGRIVGGWAVRADGSVAIGLLEDVGAAATALISAEADALTEWLDGTAITPRFRTPLEKDLTSRPMAALKKIALAPHPLEARTAARPSA